MADNLVTDPRGRAPACTQNGCGAQAGDPWCYSGPTRFRRQWHTVRTAAAKGQAAPARKPAGSLAGRRPSEKQALLIAVAAAADGTYEVSGYGFHGEAQTRRAMDAMADPARGWFTHVRETQHGTLYRLTDAGRAIGVRYDDWMNGAKW